MEATLESFLAIRIVDERRFQALGWCYGYNAFDAPC